MTTLISVLPKDILDILNVHLDEKLNGDGPSSRRPRFLRLPHPRTGLASLFLPYSKTNGGSAVLEVQAVEPNAPRSWFNGGEVIADGKLLVMTPIDPIFLLIPLLKASSANGSATNLRTLDDIVDIVSEKLAENEDPDAVINSKDISTAFELPCIKEALTRICDSKEIAPELVVYRYSPEKLSAYLEKKAHRLCQSGDIEKSRTLERQLAKDGLMEDGMEELLKAGRLKLACEVISQYVDTDTLKDLESRFDFSALNVHVANLDALSTAAIETSAGSKSGKGGQKGKENDKDGKKRKAGAQGSTGVDKLKKANIKGMSKLSNFFSKK